MRSVPVYITNELRVDGNLLGYDLAEQIFDALTVPNHEHASAKRVKRYKWWEIPEFHELFELDGDYLVLPRGFALQLKRIFRSNGIKVDWRDRTTWHRGDSIGPETFSYREHQPAAVKAIKRHRQGIYKAPTGSGKTVAICGLIWDLQPKKTLILVDRINLVNQWAKRLSEHLHPRKITMIGKIGEGRWREGSRITVATVQSIYAKRKELLESGWFDQWDLVVLDECHHVTAETYEELMTLFPARYRLGASATPDKTGEFALAQATLGPVFHEDDHEKLREQGVLIKPEVKIIYTNFNFAYWGDHSADKRGDCEVPGCKNTKPYHRHHNNYQKMLQALVRNRDRNITIAREIEKYSNDHPILVCTDQTTHIEEISKAIVASTKIDQSDVHVLTSKQKGTERDQIIESVEAQGRGIILSTIAHEGVDLPRLDVIVLAFPTRNAKKTEQQVGRGTRTASGKAGCTCIDFADPVGPFVGQLRSRISGCYQPLGLQVTTVNKQDKPQKKGLGRVGSL